MTHKQDVRPLLNTTCTVNEAIRLGELEVLRSRKRVRIICAPLRKRLGITETITET